MHLGFCRSTGYRVAIKAMKPPGPNDSDSEVKQVCHNIINNYYSLVINFFLNFQMTRNILSEIAMLSTLDHHHRIVSYLGASYRPHPIFKEDHLFIITEFMEGVSNSYHNCGKW